MGTIADFNLNVCADSCLEVPGVECDVPFERCEDVEEEQMAALELAEEPPYDVDELTEDMLHLLPRLPRLEERTSPGHHGAAAAPARPPRYGVDSGAQAATSGHHAPSHHGAAAAPARPPLDTLMVGEFISVQRCNMLRLLPEAREKAAWLTDDLIDAGNYCVMVCSF
jgi:hypothetical protein